MAHTLFSEGLARQFGLTGSVQFDFLVDEKGAVAKVKVIRVSTRPTGSKFEQALRDAGEQSVRLWRFEPAMQDGVPVQFWFEGMEVTF